MNWDVLSLLGWGYLNPCISVHVFLWYSSALSKSIWTRWSHMEYKFKVLSSDWTNITRMNFDEPLEINFYITLPMYWLVNYEPSVVHLAFKYIPKYKKIFNYFFQSLWTICIFIRFLYLFKQCLACYHFIILAKIQTLFNPTFHLALTLC